MYRLFFVLLLLVSVSHSQAQEPPRFRTDADGPIIAKQGPKRKGKNEPPELNWFSLVDGQFPPEGSAHAVSGELIAMDHLERRFQIRVDRNDSQDRGVWDLPLEATLLPYGSIYYHGAPAALQDIPLGTHLHGLFYLKEPSDNSPGPPTNNNRKTPEFDFRRCFRLEDDFSFRTRQGQAWKIESVDLAVRKLVATLQQAGAPQGKPQSFDLLTSSRVFQGGSIVDLTSLRPGQLVQFNLTWATLYGPGRIVDLWVDEPSRQLATSQQLERHRNHVRERGLAGWIDAVDDEAQIVTITFFGGIDAKLFDEIKIMPDPMGVASVKPDDKGSLRGSLAVARSSLMTYDPVNDRKGCTILEIKKIPVQPGSSGVQLRAKCDMLLEGFRPRHVVRFYPATWRVVALPREEQFFGRE